jgi:transcriptional regulator with XRE-family HTH domain
MLSEMATKKLSLSDQLRQFIETAGVSRYRISQETGISEPLLSRFMHGKAFFSEESLNTIAEALELELTKRSTTTAKSRKGK